VSGFSLEQTEKLRRVLNGGGATRFNEISGSVTHMIVGDILPADLKALKCTGFRCGISLFSFVSIVALDSLHSYPFVHLGRTYIMNYTSTHRMKLKCKINL
jgi:topoisomerase (DNA) II binding protein 1